MFCIAQDKEVVIQDCTLDVSAIEDFMARNIPKRQTCIEQLEGRCSEYTNCPLVNKRK